ncbi:MULTISPECIES: hypothetical protein [unclassified Amycolatopsis]|uniref:hypothetical protein n=1 Tax=unclassified Amycolatopsis TaxID=2618356 RepID=UPI001C694CD0|nr:hypothetical protein [Amycolatopsis sp. DSM 110486]QYN23101.1 hypothetical protein K1T34_11940 [Amycolatopsis sp. DSM 110486]
MTLWSLLGSEVGRAGDRFVPSYPRAGSLTGVDAMARVLRDRYGKAGVVGLSDAEVEEVRCDQSVAELPREWRRFLSLMGRRAGGLLFEDTDLFYPHILGIKREALDEFPSLRSRVARADDLVVVGTHSEREFYVIGGPHAAGSEVVLYIKGEEAPSYGWPSFTALLQDEVDRRSAE